MTRSSLRRQSKKARAKAREWAKVSAIASALVNHRCQANAPGCTGRAMGPGHHRRLRGQGGLNELANCLPVCPACHDFLHRNVEWAVEAGFIIQHTQSHGIGGTENPGLDPSAAEIVAGGN